MRCRKHPEDARNVESRLRRQKISLRVLFLVVLGEGNELGVHFRKQDDVETKQQPHKADVEQQAQAKEDDEEAEEGKGVG